MELPLENQSLQIRSAWEQLAKPTSETCRELRLADKVTAQPIKRHASQGDVEDILSIAANHLDFASKALQMDVTDETAHVVGEMIIDDYAAKLSIDDIPLLFRAIAKRRIRLSSGQVVHMPTVYGKLNTEAIGEAVETYVKAKAQELSYQKRELEKDVQMDKMTPQHASYLLKRARLLGLRSVQQRLEDFLSNYSPNQ